MVRVDTEDVPTYQYGVLEVAFEEISALQNT